MYPIRPPPPPPPTPPTPPPTVPPEKPDFTIEKDVRKKGDTPWLQHVTTKPGERVEFRITVKNTGQTELKNVRLRDKLPKGLENATITSQGHSGGDMFDAGTSLGNIPKDSKRELVFEAVVRSDAEACGSERMRNVAHAKPDDLPEKDDDATVEACKVPPPTPQPQPTPPAPQPPAPQPAVLPNTGAGAIAGVFSLTTLLGAALHKLKDFYLTKL